MSPSDDGAGAGTGAGARPPVRAVHLGLGAFTRAHQLWYTQHANDLNALDHTATGDGGWGFSGFTGRSAGVADLLRAQDCHYTVLERGPDGDRVEVVTALVAARPGRDTPALLAALADPAVAVVTLTVTEAGYRRRVDGGLDSDDPAVREDLRELAAAARAGRVPGPLSGVPTRLVAGLAARRAAGAGPLAVVSCDNLSDNGGTLRRVLQDAAAALDDPAVGELYAGLAGWLVDTVSLPSTMVDRIVPATSPADLARVEELTGRPDAAAVVAEPFSEWVLAGDFPAGRPAWDRVGAEVVDDVSRFEDRKLWLLNGAHSLLAYTGPVRGHRTIADAAADPACQRDLAALWDCVAPFLRFPDAAIAAYRETLLHRFTNPAIRHRLAQVAGAGSQKLAVRIVPLVHRFLDAGDDVPPPLTGVLGAWLAHLRGVGEPVDDPRADVFVPAAAGPVREAAARVLRELDPSLADRGAVVGAVAAAAADLERRARVTSAP